MKRRLIVILLTALVIMTMAVNIYGATNNIDWHLYRGYGSGTIDGTVAFSPTEDVTQAFRITVDGNFDQVASNYPLQITYVLSNGATVIDNVSSRYDYTLGQYVIETPFYDFVRGQQYDLTFMVFGGYSEITNVRIYVASLPDTGGSYGTGYEDGYADGVIKGQEDANIISNALTGFYTGLTLFMNNFLSLGIGVLTIRNMCVIMVVTFIAILIVRIVRG